jgi:hypothetical protein
MAAMIEGRTQSRRNLYFYHKTDIPDVHLRTGSSVFASILSGRVSNWSWSHDEIHVPHLSKRAYLPCAV